MPTTSPPISPEPDRDACDLSVIIVNYNVRDFLEQALRSVERASRRLSVEVFVVDNDSADGSVAMVRERFTSVVCIANETNEGFGAANNRALKRARGRYVLILNPDTIVQEDTLDTLVRFMDQRPDAGAVGCQILNPDGSFAPESRRSFPTPDVAFFRMTGLSRLFPGSRTFGRYNMTFLPRDQVAEIDALSGSCMFVRRAALLDTREPAAYAPAGLFDEAFFMYGEDLDLCFRIQHAGWKIWYTPETRIIHYKGESTKKSEFRYVRLFYGAMVLFTRKHIRTRYSGLFSALLQVAIVIRAAGSIMGEGLRRAAAPLADFVMVFATVTGLGWLRSAEAGASLAPLFFLTVAPAYAGAASIGIALAGGYRTGSAGRIRPVLVGLVSSFLLVAAVSFFVKDIAFSRVVVLTSLPIGALLLSGWRLAWQTRHHEPRRALLVGEPAEAVRLQDMLGAHPRPPFLLEGFVDPGPSSGIGDPREAGGQVGRRDRGVADGHEAPDRMPDPPENVPPSLGALRHLRDLVRLHRIRDVVFATKNLDNRDVFEWMQSLRDLPVEFRMLGEGRSHVIGKASVSELVVPELKASMSDAVRIRGAAARRAFEIPVALLGLLVWPILIVPAVMAGRNSRMRSSTARLGRLGRVLTGRLSLVGTAPEHLALVSPGWHLKEGLFNITDLLHGLDPTDGDLLRAYGFYVTHQSAALDWEIVFRTLLSRTPGS